MFDILSFYCFLLSIVLFIRITFCNLYLTEIIMQNIIMQNTKKLFHLYILVFCFPVQWKKTGRFSESVMLSTIVIK